MILPIYDTDTEEVKYLKNLCINLDDRCDQLGKEIFSLRGFEPLSAPESALSPANLALKRRGELCELWGTKAIKMSRQELLIFVGFLDELATSRAEVGV